MFLSKHKKQSFLINKCVYDVLVGESNINDVVRKTMFKTLDILPSKLILASFDANLSSKFEQPFLLLRNAVSSLKKEYEYKDRKIN